MSNIRTLFCLAFIFNLLCFDWSHQRVKSQPTNQPVNQPATKQPVKQTAHNKGENQLRHGHSRTIERHTSPHPPSHSPRPQSPIKREEEEEGGGRLDLDPAVLQVIVVSAVVNAPPVLSAATRRPAGEIGG